MSGWRRFRRERALGHRARFATCCSCGRRSISFTPGGVSIVEAALIAAMVGVGLPAARAAVAVMTYRLISLWVLLLVGCIFFIVIRSRRAK
jgi:uncharacterized protein (TIRG00374 family)